MRAYLTYFPSLFVACFILLLLFINQATNQSVQSKLMQALPILVSQSLKNAADEQLELNRISDAISARKITIYSRGLIVNGVDSIVIESILLTKAGDVNNADIAWDYGNHVISANIALKINYNYLAAALISLIISLILTCTVKLFDHVVCSNKVKWQQRLQRSGFAQQQAAMLAEALAHDPAKTALFEQLASHSQLSSEQIRLACEHSQIQQLSNSQNQWLIVALEQGKTINEAIAIALADNELIFDLNRQQVFIHGLAIRLSKTPLFYYYWYAQRKMVGTPAYLNPPATKPDVENGLVLAKLMAEFSGHQKAIRDLTDEGLKGKTLDQNRNKIKTELQTVLGNLAQEYLFESERDVKTARYKYSLKLNSSQIRIT